MAPEQSTNEAAIERMVNVLMFGGKMGEKIGILHRLANVIYWLSCLGAIALFIGAYFASSPPDRMALSICGVVVWLVARLMLYILAGR